MNESLGVWIHSKFVRDEAQNLKTSVNGWNEWLLVEGGQEQGELSKSGRKEWESPPKA